MTQNGHVVTLCDRNICTILRDPLVSRCSTYVSTFSIKIGMSRLSGNFGMFRLFRPNFGMFLLSRPIFGIFQLCRPNKNFSTLFNPVQICFGFLDQNTIFFNFLDFLDQQFLRSCFVRPRIDTFRLSLSKIYCFDFLDTQFLKIWLNI